MIVALIRCANAECGVTASESRLTAWERAAAEAIAHPRRRAEWIAGRLVAKWVLLHDDDGLEWPPEVRLVTRDALETIPPEEYRRLEVQRRDDGAPLVVGVDAQISIAHRGGWAVAARSGVGRIGVDLETIAARRSSFYETNMTVRERRWMLAAPAAETDRVGTLLWTLKEACLKTGASAARTIWEMGTIDVDVAAPVADITASWPSTDISHGHRLTYLPATIQLAGLSRSTAHAAYGLVDQLVLGVVAEHTSASMSGELS